jgi:5-aminolevulinate synthase
MDDTGLRPLIANNNSTRRVLSDLAAQLDDVRTQDLAFNFYPVDRLSEVAPHALFGGSDGRKVTVWCSNDILDMSHHPAVVESVRSAVSTSGTGSGGSPAMAGTSPYHQDLEAELASWYGKETALLFSSSYSANDSTLGVLGQRIPDLVVFSDELNHSSIKAGIRASGVVKKTFFHNDVGHLRQLLARTDPDVPKLVVFEGLYSMEGDFAPMADIVAAAEAANAMTYLDETHSMGLYGPTGAGYAELAGVNDRITIHEGGLAKAVGCIGGYIAGPRVIVDAVRMFGLPFLNTTATPAALVAGALTGVRYIRTHAERREMLAARATQLKDELARHGIPMLSTHSHVIPVLVGDAHRARELSALLLRDDLIYLDAVTTPVVPPGTERLRITANARHTPDDVSALVRALSSHWSRLGLDRVPESSSRGTR